MSNNADHALRQHFVRHQRWGFRWALWTAILWGAWYIPGTALWYEYPYNLISVDQQGERLVATAVMTWIHAMAVFLFLAVWNGTLGKLKDYGRTLVRFRKISKWYALASLFGGPMAIFGSYMAMGFVGPVFAAITSLFYPVVGTLVARLWFQEKISTQAALGMSIIILGGVVIYTPGLFGELGEESQYAWLGYLGGIMAAVGWGVEGAVASRAMDVTDPDVGIQCRFSFEILFWGLLVLPVVALLSDYPVWFLIKESLMTPWAMTWMLLASVCHAFCYTAFYKSFPLIGVSRAEAIGNLHGVFAVLFVTLVTLDLPEWFFIVGLVITVTGSFVMFREPAESVAQLRAVNDSVGSI